MVCKAFVCTFAILTAVAISGCVTSNDKGGTSLAAPTNAAIERPLPGPNLRERMVADVEASLLFRGIIDGGAPRLRDARVSRAFEYAFLFGPPQTFYCVSAEIEQPLSGLIPMVRAVSFPVIKRPDGTEQLGPFRSNVRQGAPHECGVAKYEPFPELEQARSKRRLALGKPV